MYRKLRNFHFSIFLVFGVLAGFPALAFGGEDIHEPTEDQQNDWNRFWEEGQSHKVMVNLSGEFKSATLALVGVNVIPMTGEEILTDQTVLIEGGKFTTIGPAGEVDIPGEANVITGASGKFMIPGLTEAHSHVQFSLSQFVVYLTRGVTTVREMDGFPWMLKAKEQADSGELLIPNLYVAGHILSNRAWDFYMTQVNSGDEARQMVKEQAAMGYDFIKIHNSMPEPLFSAIFEAANGVGLDVVGHIPGEILIKDAIAVGMRTNEHFKGYIFDETLTITDQDYINATKGSDLWNAPSFANRHEHLRGKEAVVLATEENSLRLVPRWMRNSWLSQAAEEMTPLTELRQSIYPKSREIFQNLWPVTQKFFAGTDTGGYAFQVPGYALQEEVRIFESLGLTPFEALQTATINSALAMRKEAEMGTIEPGKRADFVILDDNPLEGTENLKSIWGVSVRGIWLHRDSLKGIENSLEAIFSDENVVPDISPETLETLVSEMETLKGHNFPTPDYALEEIETFLEDLGHPKLSARVAALR